MRPWSLTPPSRRCPACGRTGHRLGHVLVAAAEDGREGLETVTFRPGRSSARRLAADHRADQRHRGGNIEGQNLVEVMTTPSMSNQEWCRARSLRAPRQSRRSRWSSRGSGAWPRHRAAGRCRWTPVTPRSSRRPATPGTASPPLFRPGWPKSTTAIGQYVTIRRTDSSGHIQNAAVQRTPSPARTQYRQVPTWKAPRSPQGRRPNRRGRWRLHQATTDRRPSRSSSRSRPAQLVPGRSPGRLPPMPLDSSPPQVIETTFRQSSRRLRTGPGLTGSPVTTSVPAGHRRAAAGSQPQCGDRSPATRLPGPRRDHRGRREGSPSPRRRPPGHGRSSASVADPAATESVRICSATVARSGRSTAGRSHREEHREPTRPAP